MHYRSCEEGIEPVIYIYLSLFDACVCSVCVLARQCWNQHTAFWRDNIGVKEFHVWHEWKESNKKQR